MNELPLRIEFLLEESSMENFLKVLLPKVLPENYQLGINYFLRPHNGKQDLWNSIPKKIKAFSNQNNPAKIVILHDQDNHDCKKLKRDLLLFCSKNGDCPTLIRIVCKELESWYLGDMDAIQEAYPEFKAKHYKNKEKFRTPDLCNNPSKELSRIIPEFQKGQASKRIPKFMKLEKNSSKSFQIFIRGLKNFIERKTNCK